MSRRSLLEWCFFLVVVALYLPTLAEIGHAWSTHRYGGHGVFVPVLSALILWTRRHELSNANGPRCPAGLALLAAGMGLAAVGHTTQSAAAHVVSVVLAVSGVALWLRGPQWMRGAAAPLAFLLFMLPLPGAVGGAVTLPLRLFAAGFAAGALPLVNIPVSQAGVLLQLTDVQVRVNRGCSGLSFLTVLLVVTTAFALIHLPRWWQRLTLIAAGIGAGVLANALRITWIAAAAHVMGPYGPIDDVDVYAGRAMWILTLASVLGLGVVLSLKARPPGRAGLT